MMNRLLIFLVAGSCVFGQISKHGSTTTAAATNVVIAGTPGVITATGTCTITSSSTGTCTLNSVASSSGDVYTVNVKDYGAIGDFSHVDTTNIQSAVDAAFGSASAPHGTNYFLNKRLFFPCGHYKITGSTGIVLTQVMGAHIQGLARECVTIENTTSGGPVFTTNGFSYSKVEGLRLIGAGAARLFDLNWDNTGGVSCQSNTFADNFFGGDSSFVTNSVGMEIGRGGYMCSETTLINNFFANNYRGLKISNYNALQTTVIGGNLQANDEGIDVYQGSAPIISGVGFQLSNSWDIVVENSALDTMVIQGVRSESNNFLRAANGVAVSIIGSSQTGSSNGYFVYADYGAVSVTGSQSLKGQVYAPQASVSDSTFGRADWINVRGMGAGYQTSWFLRNVQDQATPPNVIAYKHIGDPPTLSGCGSGAVLSTNANNESGSVTLGATPGVCTVTFSYAYAATPSCAVSFRGGTIGAYDVSASAVTITATGLSGVVDYHCAQ